MGKKSAAPISIAHYWENPEFLDGLLAKRLASGSVTLVLGAGVSMGFGLPSWENLVKALYKSKSLAWPRKRPSLTDLSDEFRAQFYAVDQLGFAKHVRTALYSKATATDKLLLSSELLQAVAAFLVNSIRGRAGSVVSFNFDDLLETYLRRFGLVVKAHGAAPFWQSTADVHVLHPHGILPLESADGTTPIVFTAADYDRVIGRDADPWNRSMSAIMSQTTCVFVGLSGDDARLRALLEEVKKVHPGPNQDGHAYWGMRPCLFDEAKSRTNRWKELGVAPRPMKSYSDFAPWLLGICQQAAKLRTTSDKA